MYQGDNGIIRYAVVGLGHIAQHAVLPAFANARNAKLQALVSGDEQKRSEVQKLYEIPKTYSYEQYEDCLKNGEVDAVYIALPDAMHREYSVRAARHGVHVLCEKPMAESEQDCIAMIQAASDHRVKLMIAYRLHFDAANLEAIRAAQSGELGELRIFSSLNTQNVAEGNIRLNQDLGRGPLYDMGVYCINAARYLFRSEPSEVFCTQASRSDERFREVPEMATAILRFPGERLAQFTCSYGASHTSWYRLVGTAGDLVMDPAFEYEREMAQKITVNEKSSERTFPKRDQFGPELSYFADCILQDAEPEPSGWEGLADIRIVEALNRSAKERRWVELPVLERSRRPEPSQRIDQPPVRKPELVEVKSPSGEK